MALQGVASRWRIHQTEGRIAGDSPDTIHGRGDPERPDDHGGYGGPPEGTGCATGGPGTWKWQERWFCTAGRTPGLRAWSGRHRAPVFRVDAWCDTHSFRGRDTSLTALAHASNGLGEKCFEFPAQRTEEPTLRGTLESGERASRRRLLHRPKLDRNRRG
jgi:hypothetical protein